MILETPVNILVPAPAETPVASPEVPLPPTPTVTFESAIDTIVNSAETVKQDFKGIPMVLFHDHVEVTLDKGVKRQIPYAGLKELIDRSINVKEVVHEVEGMTLPSNVFFLSQSSKELRFSSYYPGGNRDMLYDDQKLHIVAPNIIISHVLRREGKDWIVNSSCFMCTDLPVSKLPKSFISGIDASKGIYLLPMSNTYPEGKMCYGGNNMPARFKDNQFRGLDWYFRFLWETPFNSDLGIRAIGSVMSPYEWYLLLGKLAGEKKTFPYRDLSNWRAIEGAVPSESAITARRR